MFSSSKNFYINKHQKSLRNPNVKQINIKKLQRKMIINDNRKINKGGHVKYTKTDKQNIEKWLLSSSLHHKKSSLIEETSILYIMSVSSQRGRKIISKNKLPSSTIAMMVIMCTKNLFCASLLVVDDVMTMMSTKNIFDVLSKW